MTDALTDGKNRRTDGLTDRREDLRTDGRSDGRTNNMNLFPLHWMGYNISLLQLIFIKNYQVANIFEDDSGPVNEVGYSQ